MKRLVSVLAATIIATITWSQVPQKIGYQAIVRDTANNLVTNKAVGIRISILQGSADGAVVYSEIFSPGPQTNINGLVAVEIGGGIPVSGSFSAIDWSDGPYFIKTETDLSGGTNYSITGTSQILSVPYALHAKTAEFYKETDLEFLSGSASGITTDLISDWNNVSNWGNHLEAGYLNEFRKLTINGNTSDFKTDRTWNVGTVAAINTTNGIEGGPLTTSGTIKLTGQALELNNLETNGFITRKGKDKIDTRTLEAGSGIETIQGNGIGGNPLIKDKPLKVGDFAHGGVVIWVDELGRSGLVCAKSDQTEGIRWYAGTRGDTRAYGDGIGAGKMNTAIIIAAHAAIGNDGYTYAAALCNELQVTEGGTVYADWYLPSIAELNLMLENRVLIDSTATANGGNPFFPEGYYWSSTEMTDRLAWMEFFYTGHQEGYYKEGYTVRVRAVRTF
jgi:hypothetical protein